MSNSSVRPCGIGWSYCSGNCRDCALMNVVPSTNTNSKYDNIHSSEEARCRTILTMEK